MQERFARANKAAWETKAYQAWVRNYGLVRHFALFRGSSLHFLRGSTEAAPERAVSTDGFSSVLPGTVEYK